MSLVGWAAARQMKGATFTTSETTPVPRPAAERGDYRALLLERLQFIESTVESIARRHALTESDANDLAQQVKLRLIANDYAVLRKFQGRSRLTTYLTTVIQNIFRDYRIQQWGKWRPSAAAKRFGDRGVQLEALLYRDGFTLSEALELMRSRYDSRATDEELFEIAAGLRPRTSRRFESDAVLSRLEGPERSDQRVVDGERRRLEEKVQQALVRVLDGLSEEDRLILKLRFTEGLTIRAVASTLDFDQRRIYSRIRRLLRGVRRRMVNEGVRCEEVLDLLDWPACAVESGLSTEVPMLSRHSA